MVQAVKKRRPKAVKESKHDVVDVGDCGGVGVSADSTVEESIGALDWLLGAMDSERGGAADWPTDPVDDEGDLHEPLDLDSQLDNAALSYGAAEETARYERLRRIAPAAVIERIEDHFGDDGDAMELVAKTQQIVTKALFKKDAWSYEWIFGAQEVQKEGIPPRSLLLEYFNAREVVFQTRVQYQLLLEGISYSMKFPVKGMPRIFLWNLTSMLAEAGTVISIEHGLTIMEQLWRNPGCANDRLWDLYEKSIVARPSQTELKPAEAAFKSCLDYLELNYLISRHSKTNNWHFTGRNPARQVEELRRDMRKFNAATINRGWSSWF